MTDPYQVLGVSSTATDDEITKAYRRLAKKYHPDINPGNKIAEQKMREANAAYDQIKTERQGGNRQNTGSTYKGSNGGSAYSNGDNNSYDPFAEFFGGGSRGYQQGNGFLEMQMARRLVLMCRYQEALRMLESITNRSCEWYYYSAIAHAGIGDAATALSYAKEAVRMEPDNAEYIDLLEQFKQGQYASRQNRRNTGFSILTPFKIIAGLIMAQFFFQLLFRLMRMSIGG